MLWDFGKLVCIISTKSFIFITALCYVHSLYTIQYTEDNLGVLGQHNAGLDTVNAKDRPIELVNLT